MQLLKLTQNFNAVKQTRSKINPRNSYLNILQSCAHVPKDDKLIIRKYLSSLAPEQLNQNNQIIALLEKYGKKQKQKIKDCIDKKLEVLLRKFADRLRKQQQWFIIVRQEQNSQNIPKVSEKKVQINPSKYCNNFQIMKSSIRNHSGNKNRSLIMSPQHSMERKKSKERHPLGEISFKSRITQNSQIFRQQQRQKQSKNKMKKMNGLRSLLYTNNLLNSQKPNFKFFKTQHRQKRVKKSDSLTSLKQVYSYKNKQRQQQQKQVNKSLQKFRLKQPPLNFGYYNKKREQLFEEQQNSDQRKHQLQYYIYNQNQTDTKRNNNLKEKLKKTKHKQTKSRSLGDIVMNKNDQIQQIIEINLQNQQTKRYYPKIKANNSSYINFNIHNDDNQNLIDNLNHQISSKFVKNNELQPYILDAKMRNYTTTDNQNNIHVNSKQQYIFNSVNSSINSQSLYFNNNPNSAFNTQNNSKFNSNVNSNYNSLQNTPSNLYPKQQNLQQCIKLPPLPNLQNMQLNNTTSSASLSYSLSNFNTFNSNYSNKQFTTKSIHAELKSLNICSQDFHDFVIPPQIKQSRSPSDLSLPYQQFVNKLNQYIASHYKQVPQPFTSIQNLYIPFHTQYDLVTFEKLSHFIDQYTFAKYHNNNVKDIYTRIQISVVGFTSIHASISHKRISIQDFRKAYQWKKPQVKNKFQQLVKRCNRWGTCITYWELYWLKNSPQFKQFQKLFNAD